MADIRDNAVHAGENLLSRECGEPVGEYVELSGEHFYRIRNYDAMAPFFMSIVSSSDHWMFISSTGGLTAGRRNSNSALFPYYTDDRITENSDNTGPLTIFLIETAGHIQLWEPFSIRQSGIYRIERNLYKNVSGNKIIFEEVNRDLGLSYSYSWRMSGAYGIVKTARLSNKSSEQKNIRMLDGVQNILPYGATTAVQTEFSNLLNAYKRAELEPQSGIGIFSLSSTLTDLAEPSESLMATTVFQLGLQNPCILLSSLQIEKFRNGGSVQTEKDIRGQRGAYLLNTEFSLEPGQTKAWSIIAELNQDAADIAALMAQLKAGQESTRKALEADIAKGDQELTGLVASADGLQLSGDELSTAHHFSNVLFNIMRGGIFANGYIIDMDDFLEFIAVRNREVLQVWKAFFDTLPEKIEYGRLLQLAAESGSVDIERLSLEYLPLTFSRRHGDPSRPWNIFQINLRKADGSRQLDYQGNWRDIFQNWEALAQSYPLYIEGMISKFLNATTADGYNPYRVTRNGIEWEVPQPDNPWANIGYWGDHQIVYLQKLLELSLKFHPGMLSSLLTKNIFSHANVPYRIREYSETLNNCFDTIVFDHELEKKISDAVRTSGSDARLLRDVDGKVLHTNLLEKLLILLLVKLGNFVPEGGIWMNTQRPEWNDANNALAGKGLSVVTLCYLRRFIVFLHDFIGQQDLPQASVSSEVVRLLQAVHETLREHQEALAGNFSDEERRSMMDRLGGAASDYRLQFYREGFSGTSAAISRGELLEFLELSLRFVEHTLRKNERPDGLYHSYNVLKLNGSGASVGNLYEMLEGQVAVLSSGMLSGEQSLTLLRNLRNSRMYRPDQHSYMLYPDRELPGFLRKNVIPKDHAEQLSLVSLLVKNGDTSLIRKDLNGEYHFNGRFRNEKDVKAALETLSVQEAYAAAVRDEREAILELFEEVFHHDEFTGRSGTFFAFEGLGSIYWHMVSKLLLAVQENIFKAAEAGEAEEVVNSLIERYYDIRAGLGFNKAPSVYGAFPTDPYSHTPSTQGAKQPGMTGQVKEEILTRLGELGIVIEEGCITFKPLLLRREEFIHQEDVFRFLDVRGNEASLVLPAGSLAFTFCQVPVVLLTSDEEDLEVELSSGEKRRLGSCSLDDKLSRHIFDRDGQIRMIRIHTGRGK